MRAPGFQPALDQRRALQPFAHEIVSARRFAARLHHGHAGALHRMPADGGIDRAVRPQVAGHHGEIAARHGTRLQLAHQVGLRFQCAGDHQQAGGVAVQPVHDAGARHLRQSGHAMQQRVEQRAIRHAIARMHHHAGRFVDHQQRVVLEHHVERDVLRRMHGVRRQAARIQFETFTGESASTRVVAGLPVHPHPALAQPALQAAARVLRPDPGEHHVEPLADHAGWHRCAYRDLGRARGQLGDIIVVLRIFQGQSGHVA